MQKEKAWQVFLCDYIERIRLSDGRSDGLSGKLAEINWQDFKQAWENKDLTLDEYCKKFRCALVSSFRQQWGL